MMCAGSVYERQGTEGTEVRPSPLMAEGRPVRSRASERSPRPGAHGVKGMLYPTRCRRGANLPFLGREPAGMDEPLKSVTHGQCDARPTVTFPAAGHHRPFTGIKVYCLVMG